MACCCPKPADKESFCPIPTDKQSCCPIPAEKESCCPIPTESSPYPEPIYPQVRDLGVAYSREDLRGIPYTSTREVLQAPYVREETLVFHAPEPRPRASHVRELRPPINQISETQAPPPKVNTVTGRLSASNIKASTFEATLVKAQGSTWNLDLDFEHPRHVKIFEVRDGPATSYNAANPEQKIETGDWIEAVNGEEESPMAMAMSMMNTNTIHLRVRKAGAPETTAPSRQVPKPAQRVEQVQSVEPKALTPQPTPAADKQQAAAGRFQATLQKAQGTTWNVDLDFGHPQHLLIRGVRQGPFEAYNSANPGRQIEAGDWIEAVNGQEGSTMTMAFAVRDNNKINVRVRKHYVVESESLAAL